MKKHAFIATLTMLCFFGLEAQAETKQVENMIIDIPEEWVYMDESIEDGVSYYYYSCGKENFTIVIQKWDESVNTKDMVGAYAKTFESENAYSYYTGTDLYADGHDARLDYFYCDQNGEYTSFMDASIDTGECVADFVYFCPESEETPALESFGNMLDNIDIIDSDSSSEYLFRGFEWGTSIEDVMEKEITDDMEEDIDYYYDGNTLTLLSSQLAGYDAYTYFTFQNGGLVEGRYILKNKHTNDLDYYEDYCGLIDLYKEKYGEPTGSDENWKDDLYKDDYQDWGFAISIGHVSFDSYWKGEDDSTIICGITGDNYEITTYFNYRSPDYQLEKNADGI